MDTNYKLYKCHAFLSSQPVPYIVSGEGNSQNKQDVMSAGGGQNWMEEKGREKRA